MSGVFERFSDEARHVIVSAQDEARLLQHASIGTEHLLLGVVGEERGLAAAALAECGITLAATRVAVASVVGMGDDVPGRHIPFTPEAKRALELSLREAIQLGDRWIGAEHVLLGLVRVGDVAGDVLLALGVDPDDVRTAVVAARAGDPSSEPGRATRRPFVSQRMPFRCSFCGRDLTDVGRYVRGGADICEGCVATAVTALAAADREGAAEARVWLPPHVDGSGPEDAAAAVEAIEAAFDVVRASTMPADAHAVVLDDPADAAVVQAVHGRFLGRAPEGRIVVQRLQFLDADTAAVSVVLFTGLARGAVAGGHVHRRDGCWLVGHDVVAALARSVGVWIPPEEAA